MATSFTNFQAVPIDGALPVQNTSTSGKALVSNGTNAQWNTVLSMIGTGPGQTAGSAVATAILPSQTGNSGKVLTTDGNGVLSWTTPTSGGTSGVSSVVISGVTYTGDVTISNVPSATTAGNVTGVVGVANGGTGATSASQALTNLGAAAANHTHNYAPLASPSFTGTPTAPTAAAGTNNTQLATTAFVMANVNGLGYNQTLQDVTASRVLGVTYTNTTSKPIMVHVGVGSITGNSSSLRVSINGATSIVFATGAPGGAEASTDVSGSVIIQAGQSYNITEVGGTGPNLLFWTELR
jgi:hypothetical protein